MELDLQRFYNINRRVMMWLIFFVGLFLLRNFFALVFLTFIFGFLMRKVARFLVTATRTPYKLAVVLLYLVAVILLSGLMATAVPRVVDEGAKFSRQVPQLFEKLAREVQQAARYHGLEPALAKYLNIEPHSVPTTTPDNVDKPAEITAVNQQFVTETLANRLQHLLLESLPAIGSEEGNKSLPDVFRQFILGVAGGTLNFMLAIILSLLIVLDYDNITRELIEWRQSPVGLFFHEAAASVVEFSGAVGTAFQCQMAVATLNACITCVGMFLLDIQPLVLLTTIVFLCGLIPVLGVFISSIPIILIAFNDAGFAHTVVALGMIIVVHLLEAYVFNPRIYAARFHLNPVIVLIILLVAEKLFGIWGMLLGIPVTHYVLNLAQMPSRPRRTLRKIRQTRLDKGETTSEQTQPVN